MSLRFFNIKWRDADEYLKSIGLMTAKASHKWAIVFIKGYYEEFSSDFRGGKQTDSFYETFPEIEADVKAVAVQECSKKSGEFKALDLAQFIDEKYYELAVKPGFAREIKYSTLDIVENCNLRFPISLPTPTPS